MEPVWGTVELGVYSVRRGMALASQLIDVEGGDMDINRSFVEGGGIAPEREPAFKDKLKQKTADVSSRVSAKASALTRNTTQQLKAHPAKWAGIAAGSGIALGMLGRWLYRRRQLSGVEGIFIIETC
jgi:hypothetical protein